MYLLFFEIYNQEVLNMQGVRHFPNTLPTIEMVPVSFNWGRAVQLYVGQTLEMELSVKCLRCNLTSNGWHSTGIQ